MTTEIIKLPELGLVKIRIIEDDGSYKTEPCYPAEMFESDEALENFAVTILGRIQNERQQNDPIDETLLDLNFEPEPSPDI